MKTKLILLLLALLLSASCLCLFTPEPAEELMEKHGMAKLVLGFLAVAAGLGAPLMAPFLLFKRVS